MANTKELSRDDRKKAKREQRKELKKFGLDFTRVERKGYRKAKIGGIKGFKLGTNEED